MAEHEAFQADARCRLAGVDPLRIAEEIHAEVLERLPQRRKASEVERMLAILDEIGGEGS